MRACIATLALAAMAALSPIALAQDADGGTRGELSGIRGGIDDFEPNNDTLVGATPINFYGRLTAVGILNLEAGDSDYFKVTLAVDDVIGVFTVPLRSLPFNFLSVDTVLSVFNPSGTLIITDDDAGTGQALNTGTLASAVRVRASVAGTYTIRVSGFANTSAGKYGLLVAKMGVANSEYMEEAGATTAQSAILANQFNGPLVGDAVSGTNDLDYYAIDMNPGDVLLAATTSIDGLPGNLNTPNMTMRLLEPDGTTQFAISGEDIGGNVPGGDNTSNNPFILARANQKGRFFVELAPVGTIATDDSYRIVTWVIPGNFCSGDADGSGIVNFADLTNVLLNFNNSCP